jgi:serine/threonine-protein kinase
MMGRAEAANVEAEQGRARTTLQLGKYQLLAVLGRGGMAEVFLALSRGAMGFDKLAVIKRLRPGMADDESFRRMFLDEARLAARLNHPNVVHTYEAGEHDNVYFIAMEYLEGQSLNKVVREAEKRGTPLSPLMSARIISDALAGLHHAHTLTDFDGRPLGIIHRDISPHNLFVTYEGTTKVVDFGIAKAALSSTETEVGVLKGKVAYMSPEQATGAPLDARSDVFAMGIVLWEMLTLRRLMTGDTAASTLHRLLTVQVPPASTIRPDVDPTLDAIVQCSLQKDPNRRFPSALAMREALEAYIASTGRPVRTEEIGQQIGGMFVEVREAIKRQIQEHVEGAGRVPPPQPDDSMVQSASAVRPREGTMVSAELPMLNVGGGSGSGMVSNPSSRVSVVEVSAAQHAAYPPVSGANSGVPGSVAAGSVAAGSVAAGSAPGAASGVSKGVLVGAFVFLLVAVIGSSVGIQLVLARRAPPPVADETSFGAPHPSAAPAPAPSGVAATPAATALPAVAAVPGALSASAQPVAAAPATPHGAHGHHGGTSPGTSQATAPAAAAPSPDSLGYVTFDTYPWTRVSEGGTQLGTTPLVHVALPAGTHNLTLDNPDQNIHQTYTLTVKAGESMTKHLGLK